MEGQSGNGSGTARSGAPVQTAECYFSLKSTTHPLPVAIYSFDRRELLTAAEKDPTLIRS